MAWHDMKRRRTYQCWQDMKQRCFNEANLNWPNYGGRGITVCDRWRTFFEAFVSDMGEKPDGMSIDRIDVDGNYEPMNCRWLSAAEQQSNRRDCIYLEHEGKRMTIQQWSRELGIHDATLRSRYKQKWPISDVLSKAKQLRGRHSKPRQYAAMKDHK